MLPPGVQLFDLPKSNVNSSLSMVTNQTYFLVKLIAELIIELSKFIIRTINTTITKAKPIIILQKNQIRPPPKFKLNTTSNSVVMKPSLALFLFMELNSG